MRKDADVIVVGAGTAGCVLASRLSEDPHRKVLLVEAGEDFMRGAEPSDIASVYPLSYSNPRYLWRPLAASWRSGSSPVPFSQGGLVGGGSAVMGMWAVRGFPDDYDEWESAGAAGWGWRDVLPFFVRMEHDKDFGGAMHGAAGPVQVRRQRLADWPPFCGAVASAAQRLGLTRVDDINAEFGNGIGVLPISATHRRVSAASAYLTPEARARPNLRIAAQTRCARVLVEGRQVTGIEAVQGRSVRTLRTPQVILAAGALQSPAILMRSGIGEADALRSLGLPVLCERRGVGANLQNHPFVALGVHLLPQAVQRDQAASAAFLCLRMSSAAGAPLRSDLYFSVLNRSSWHYFGRRLATLGAVIHKPFSRGRIDLSSADPLAPPRVNFGFLSDDRDLHRLVEALRIGARILADEQVGRMALQAGLVSPGRLARCMGTRSITSRALDVIFSTCLPRLPGLERRLFDSLLGVVPVDALLAADDGCLREHVTRAVAGLFHPVGTCRMGRHGDADAVVDHQGRVHGLNGLRVADASIMPTIPRAGTFLPTVMIAEKISSAIISGVS